MDLPLIGRKFTWFGGRSQNRLDQGLMVVEWTIRFLELKLWALNKPFSDHCPLLLETNKENWRPKLFRSIDAWLSHSSFIKKVKEE